MVIQEYCQFGIKQMKIFQVVPTKYGYVNMDSVSIANKLISLLWEHGTNVAGITSGKGNKDGYFKGVAPFKVNSC